MHPLVDGYLEGPRLHPQRCRVYAQVPWPCHNEQVSSFALQVINAQNCAGPDGAMLGRKMATSASYK